MRKNTIFMEVIQRLCDGEIMASIDCEYANANQYFRMAKMYVELYEKWVKNKKNKGRHKERWLNPTPSNIKKAKNLLQDT